MTLKHHPNFTDALNSPLSSELSLKLCYNPTQVTQDGDYTKQVMNDSPTMANINKNAFTITRHRKIEVPSIDNTGISAPSRRIGGTEMVGRTDE
ncbi:uncharacterized protein LOC108253495 isoform X4 [Diaphorina citri]|uniref:Uncharacterized protein LOC108253495 isoform X4 n=1 Tax=Diaphorina citri TaxID=121845 RepID=A0A3Q0JFT9_DIACI|nr:uncharacterized protein LOC108253495 isoform X4 [Diaphorina citri]